jgi:hypothetical protein
MITKYDALELKKKKGVQGKLQQQPRVLEGQTHHQNFQGRHDCVLLCAVMGFFKLDSILVDSERSWSWDCSGVKAVVEAAGRKNSRVFLPHALRWLYWRLHQGWPYR